MNFPTPLLEIDDLVVTYRLSLRRTLTAVDHVSLVVHEGETVGLVGESGSGKSTTGSAVLGLAPVTSGRIRFAGEDITRAAAARRRRLSAQLQVIFQDPYGSLNPSQTIGRTLAEPLLVHGRRAEAPARIREMLDRVGLDESAARRYPAQFSGGQRQRIAIARALMMSPRLVICDEAVSALDLSIQAQVLNLLLELQRDLRMSYLFISHDLSVVRHMCDRIVVLYRGAIVESGDTERVCTDPQHPYTQRLLASSPVPDPVVQGEHRRQRASLMASDGTVAR
jgi:peptide/nickel transport system ATP-binding protein